MKLKTYQIFIQESNSTSYPIQVPPNKEESINLVISQNTTWFINDKEVSDPKEIYDGMMKGSESGARHEALHFLQEKNIPEIFQDKNHKNLEIKSEWFEEIKNNNWSLRGIKHEREFINYFSNPCEIMAYSFSYVLIKNKREAALNSDGKIEEDVLYELNSDKIYQSIGGAVLNRFKDYCNQYERVLD